MVRVVIVSGTANGQPVAGEWTDFITKNAGNMVIDMVGRGLQVAGFENALGMFERGRGASYEWIEMYMVDPSSGEDV